MALTLVQTTNAHPSTANTISSDAYSAAGAPSQTRWYQRISKTGIALWLVQVPLAALFLFAGSFKFLLPPEVMAQGPVVFPLGFIYFIGVCEVLGGLGLVLPGLSRIRPGLTPLAAAGLVIIMIGATATTAVAGIAAALFPFVVGVLCAVVAYGRYRLAPHRNTWRRSAAPATSQATAARPALYPVALPATYPAYTTQVAPALKRAA